MTAHPAIFAFGFLLAVSAASDAAVRRIPNLLTVALAAGGLGVQLAVGGPAAAAAGLAAGLLVGAMLWLPWLRGWLGGGDLKLAVGAALWVGWGGLTTYALVSALAAGGMAVVAYAASTRRARAEMRSNLKLAALAHGVSVQARATRGRVSVPAGAAFAAGALAAVIGG